MSNGHFIEVCPWLSEQASSTFPQTTVSGSLDKLTKSGALFLPHCPPRNSWWTEPSVTPFLGVAWKMGEEEEEEKKAATTQFDIVRSDSFLRDGGLLPGQVLDCNPQPKVFAGDLPSVGVHRRPNWPFLPGLPMTERAQGLPFNFNLKGFHNSQKREEVSLFRGCNL